MRVPAQLVPAQSAPGQSASVPAQSASSELAGPPASELAGPASSELAGLRCAQAAPAHSLAIQPQSQGSSPNRLTWAMRPVWGAPSPPQPRLSLPKPPNRRPLGASPMAAQSLPARFFCIHGSCVRTRVSAHWGSAGPHPVCQTRHRGSTAMEVVPALAMSTLVSQHNNISRVPL